jgi:hypothetical protein
MSQLLQVAAAGTTSIGQRAAATGDRLLLTDYEYDKLAAGLVPATLTDLGPGLLATAPVSLATLIESGLQVATFSPTYPGVVSKVAALVTTPASTAAKLASVGVFISGPGGTSEVDTITINGVPTGGTFTVTVGGVTSAAVAFNATGAVFQTALEAMSNIAVGDVTVAGGAGGPYTATWARAFASQPITLTFGNALTGGTTPTITYVKTTAGVLPTVGVNSTLNGGVVAMTTANSSVAGAIVPGTNIVPSSFGSVTSNSFINGSTIYLRVVGAPTAFVEGAVSFILSIEPFNPRSVPMGSGHKNCWP